MTAKQLITIDASTMPNKAISVTYEVPNFGDLRKSRKLYPHPTREGESKPPYSVEELLFASLIKEIKVNGKVIKESPKDLPSKLEPLPIDDRQSAMIEFINTCFLDDDQAKTAKIFADEQRNLPPKPTVLVPGKITPTGRSFLLNRPSTGTQWEADRVYKSPQENGCNLDEMLLAMCVADINGKPIEESPKDLVAIFDQERIDEIQFLSTVFVNLFLLGDDEAKEARNRGKQKKAQLGLGKPSTVVKDTSTPV